MCRVKGEGEGLCGNKGLARWTPSVGPILVKPAPEEGFTTQCKKRCNFVG
jgi:hypothetical protein